jgi:hypothetical protein
LDEKTEAPAGYEMLSPEPNGFYKRSCIQDFSVRDHRVKLYVRRRRWIEKTNGTSISKDWEVATHSTRHSKEFAAFFKGLPT